jgi:hypothetical protein
VNILEKINKNINWINNGIFIPDSEINKKFSHGLKRILKVIYIDKYYKKYCSVLEKYDDLLSESNIYIYHDNPITSKYLLNKFDEFYLIEDGLANYSQENTGLRVYFKKMFGIHPDFGRNPKIKKIYVKEPKKLPTEIRKKGCKFNINDFIQEMSYKNKKKIFKIFIDEIEIKEKKNNILIITQPLSEDNFTSEREKINIYSKIIETYGEGCSIYIKPHPRELTDYRSLKFNNITILNRTFPLEILNFLDENLFDTTVTLFSSAINNINFSTNKVFLGKKFINDFLD